MTRNRRGFTLVELLVVIAIIGVLLALLLPALSRARKSAQAVQCANNLRQYGHAFALYAHDYNGFIIKGMWHYLDASEGHARKWAYVLPKLYKIGRGKPSGSNFWDKYKPDEDITTCHSDEFSKQQWQARNTGSGLSYVGNAMIIRPGATDNSWSERPYKLNYFRDASRRILVAEKPGWLTTNDQLVTQNYGPNNEQLNQLEFRHGGAGRERARRSDGNARWAANEYPAGGAYANALYLDFHVGPITWSETYRLLLARGRNCVEWGGP